MAKQRFETKDYQKSRRTQKIALLAIGVAVLSLTLVTFPSFIQRLMGIFGSDARSHTEYGSAMFLAFICAIELALLILIPIWAGYYGWHRGRGMVFRQNARYADKQGIEYYRDTLKDISPALMSILMDMRIEDRKDVSATLLSLYDKGIIGFEGENIVCYQYNAPLRTDERELYDMLLSGGITPKAALLWKKNRLREAIENGYIKDDSGRRNDFNQKGCQRGCLGMGLIVIVGVVLLILLSGGIKDFIDDENSMAIKIMGLYGVYTFGTLEDARTALDQFEEIFGMQDATVSADDIVTSGSGGDIVTGEDVVFAADIHELVEVLWKSALFFFYMVLVAGYPFFIFLFLCGYDSVKMKTQFARTEKGNELAEKIAGLQRFIHDFSALSEREKEEVLLWNDFLVYAVVLEENDLIPNDVISRFYKYLAGLYYSETSHADNFRMQFEVKRDKNRNDTIKQPWKK